MTRSPIELFWTAKNTNLLSVSKLFSGDKVEDIYVRNPNVVNIHSQILNAWSLAGIPRQELILPLKIEPEIRRIERCIFDVLMLLLIREDREPHESCEGLVLWIHILYLHQGCSQRHINRLLCLRSNINS